MLYNTSVSIGLLYFMPANTGFSRGWAASLVFLPVPGGWFPAGMQKFLQSLLRLGRAWLGRARLLQLFAYTFMSIASGLGLAFAAQITVHFLKLACVL